MSIAQDIYESNNNLSDWYNVSYNEARIMTRKLNSTRFIFADNSEVTIEYRYIIIKDSEGERKHEFTE